MTNIKELSKEGSEESLASVEGNTLDDDKLKMEDDAEAELPSGVEEVKVECSRTTEPQDEWMDIIGSGDLKKKVLVPAIVDSRPVRGDTVLLDLTMRLSDGSLVKDAHTITFTLGDCEVIQGLDLVVPLMDRGEKSEVYMDSRFAYGSKGEADSVPCNMALLCIIQLKDFWPEEGPESLSLTQRQQVGNRKRIRGNWWFNRGDYSEAVQCYKAAVDFLDDTEDTYGEVTPPEVMLVLEERLKALNNMAAAQIKLAAYDAALASVETVLSCQPDNVKALFRKGKVLQQQGSLSTALACLKRALQLEPENRAIHTELAKLTDKLRQEADAEKSLYRRMLGLKGGDKREGGQDRYPTLRVQMPWRMFLAVFTCIVCVLVAYNYRDLLYTALP